MARQSSIRKSLEKIAETEEFSQLEPFLDPKKWTRMSSRDKELLAKLFAFQGKQLLDQGSNQAIEYFEKATKLAEGKSDIYMVSGLALSEQTENISCLKRACEYFHYALENAAEHSLPNLAIAQTLSRLGSLTGESHYFSEAGRYYENAAKTAEKDDKVYKANCYRRWAENWYSLGRISGEAQDFRSSIEKFQIAAKLGCRQEDFWNSYGNAYIELGFLLENMEYYEEAIHFYRKAVRENPNYFAGWLNLGCAAKFLFEQSGQESSFTEAIRAFEKALSIDKCSSIAWAKCAEVYLNAGKIKRDPEAFNHSIPFFKKANELSPDDCTVLSAWGEAEMFYGIHTERLDLLRGAEEHFLQCCQKEPEDVWHWYLFGSCLTELGHYFLDEEYFNQAIEKYHYALGINQRDSLLWYGLASAYNALSACNNDPQDLERALGYYRKAFEMGSELPAQFWREWGGCLMKWGQINGEEGYIKEAIEKLELALYRSGNLNNGEIKDVEALFQYGVAWDLLGDLEGETSHYEKAIQVLLKAVQMDPEFCDARFHLANAFSHLGEVTSDIECFFHAQEHFQRVLAADPEDEIAWCDSGLAALNLAQLIYDPSLPDQGEKLYKEAEDKFLHAIALGNEMAFYNIACLYSLIGNQGAAMHYLERAEQTQTLPDVEDLLHDEWLLPLRQTEEFQSFFERIRKKHA